MELKDFTQLKELMKTGKINFTYVKTNGDVRNATGTLDLKYIDERGGTPNGTGYEVPENVLRYWDVNSDGWRSCRINLIQSFELPDDEQQKLNF